MKKQTATKYSLYACSFMLLLATRPGLATQKIKHKGHIDMFRKERKRANSDTRSPIPQTREALHHMWDSPAAEEKQEMTYKHIAQEPAIYEQTEPNDLTPQKHDHPMLAYLKLIEQNKELRNKRPDYAFKSKEHAELTNKILKNYDTCLELLKKCHLNAEQKQVYSR